MSMSKKIGLVGDEVRAEAKGVIAKAVALVNKPVRLWLGVAFGAGGLMVAMSLSEGFKWLAG